MRLPVNHEVLTTSSEVLMLVSRWTCGQLTACHNVPQIRPTIHHRDGSGQSYTLHRRAPFESFQVAIRNTRTSISSKEIRASAYTLDLGQFSYLFGYNLYQGFLTTHIDKNIAETICSLHLFFITFYLMFDLQNCLLYIAEPTFSMTGVKKQFENIEKDQHKWTKTCTRRCSKDLALGVKVWKQATS